MIKKTYRSLIKGADWILAGILSILGFAGCSIIESPDEYGAPYAPYASFTFHGTVADTAGQPVKNIKIEIDGGYYKMDSAQTGTSGEYSIQFQSHPLEEFNVIASDIDGEANGLYQNDTVQVKIAKTDYYEKGKSAWDYGSAAKKVDIVLKEKEND